MYDDLCMFSALKKIFSVICAFPTSIIKHAHPLFIMEFST